VIADLREAARSKSGETDLSTWDYQEQILDCASRGCTYIVVTGGEPTVRRDFVGLVSFASSLGLYIVLQTNGRAFCNPFLAKHACSYVNEFVIALHGPNAEIHDSITRSMGSFNQTICGMRNIMSFGARKISGKIVLSRRNYPRLCDTIKLLHSLGIYRINVTFPHARGNAKTWFHEVVPRYAEVRPFIEEAIQYSDRCALRTTFEAVLPCALTTRPLDMGLFSDFDEAKLAVKEVKQLHMATQDWNQLRVSIKRKDEVCRSCRYDPSCEGYWSEYVDAYGFGEFEPIPLT
jgi:MoaA/NifB/PqqE/SkfB family radical SAM enzyme